MRHRERMKNMTPPGYERKFADFIKLCREAKANGISHVIIANPREIGDSYEEITESLSRMADSGLGLHITGR